MEYKYEKEGNDKKIQKSDHFGMEEGGIGANLGLETFWQCSIS